MEIKVARFYGPRCTLHFTDKESRTVAGKTRDAAVNFDRYGLVLAPRSKLFVSFDTFSGS